MWICHSSLRMIFYVSIVFAIVPLSAHAEIVFMRESQPKGGVAALRKLARKLTEKQLTAIDKLAQSIINLTE
jgi:hypothetical protein